MRYQVSQVIQVSLLAAILFIVSAASFAGTRPCTTALVTAGICRATSDVVYTLSISTTDPDGAGPLPTPSALIQDAFTSVLNYMTPVNCTADMVGTGICTSLQLGQSVSITKPQFVDLQVRSYVLAIVRRYRVQLNVAAAQVSAESTPDPDLGQ